MKDYILNVDLEVIALENENRWYDAALYAYRAWKNQPSVNRSLSAGTQIWYTLLLIEYDQDSPCSQYNRTQEITYLQKLLMEITNYGFLHFGDNASFHAYFGYMIKVKPLFFEDCGGDYIGWWNKGVAMMKRAHTLDPYNPVATAMYYEADDDSASEYQNACRDLWMKISPCEWGKSGVQVYFNSILYGNLCSKE